MQQLSTSWFSNYGSMNQDGPDTTLTFLQDKGAMAMGFAKMKQLELKHYIDEGHWSWHMAGFTAGLLIIFTSLSNFCFHFLSLSWIAALSDIYLFLSGLLACLLEFKQRLMTQWYVDMIRREALFLYRPYGRGAFYFFVGLLQIDVNGGLQGWLIGLYICVTGIIVYFASQQSVKQLALLKSNINNEAELAEKFKLFDHDQTGFLEADELTKFAASLGATMTEDELQVALLILDTNRDGKIAFNELSEWWRGKAGEHSI